ncbi:putative competence/damage-inducible protein CinA [Pleomassaria siparia CBS 279.74]|uniref:Putative competence/damage-inducible protein CinA n=1 Tax=Pleomassaria siparia CBS 279.74 TaxID=1314801 RepID=A0A6G1KGA2_9PLEO|nr:putative competence/damage-inducible protein CinA [Pleomassaria siparia CBS 279.74]
MSSSSFPPSELREVVKEVATLLKERKETISVAETAAGGLISASLLSFPGASGYYKGGTTLYTLESRIAYAGWTDAHITNYAGPTPEIVAGLAEHTRKTLGSTYTVSESGTAGPANPKRSGHKNGAPGYVALAVARDGGESVTREVETGLGNDREGNMVAFAVEGLKLVRDVIKRDNGEGKL